MLGAIVGDICGSVHEFRSISGHWRDFPLFTKNSCFTDDTVMTLAVCEGLKRANRDGDKAHDCLIDAMHDLGAAYPGAGYGGHFARWLKHGQRDSYNSFGNGSAMRVSSVGWAFDNLEDVEKFATLSAAVTHNHPEGIKGACSVAAAIFLGRKGASKEEIKSFITDKYGYDLDRSLEDIRKDYSFDVTCQGSVPEAIIAFLESGNLEEAVRKAIWLRGDADTQAAIAGSIAEAFYGEVPADISKNALARLDTQLRRKYAELSEWLHSRAK